MSDKVIPFPGASTDNTDYSELVSQETKPSKAPNRCNHRRTTIDREQRSLSCLNCGCEMDAFDWVLRLTEDTSNYFKQRDHLKKDIAQKRQSLEKLYHEEKNAKARLKTARASMEKVVVDQRDVQLAKDSLRKFRETVND